MPNKHAALKEMRKGWRLQLRNQAVRSELKTLTKRLVVLLNSQQLDEAKRLIHVVASKYDRAASSGIIHRNTASRYKSRLMRRINQRASAPPTANA